MKNYWVSIKKFSRPRVIANDQVLINDSLVKEKDNNNAV